MQDFIPAIQWSSAILPVLNEGHTLKIPLSGLSMFPLIKGGRDEAVLSSTKGKKLKCGDIVLYAREDGTHVLHRIHHLKNDDFFMLGDAHTSIEGPIKRKYVLAVAEAIIRKGKEISCNRVDFRIISTIWLIVRPVRPVIMRVALKLYGFLKH